MRLIRGLPALVVLVALAPGSPAAAEDRVAQGSPLAAPANYPYGCETRWTPGFGGQPGAFGPGGAQEYGPENFGPTTCSLHQIGPRNDAQQSHLVPGPGTVTTARVKAGPDPIAVSIAVIRGFTGPDGFGGTTTTCCNQQSETPVVQLTPNVINTIPVNLAVDTQQYDPQKQRVGFYDRVAVNVHSTSGRLPLSDLGGSKPLQAPEGDPAAYWYFPKFETGQNNQNQWTASGFEVLMNFDWCATGSTTAGCGGAAGGGPTGPSPPTGGGTNIPAGGGPTVAPAKLSRSTLARNGKSVGVRVACTQATPCKGSVSLRSRGTKAFTLGKRKLTLGAKKSATVKVPLSSRARSLVRRSSRVKVTATVDLGAAGTVKKAFTLRGRKR